MSTKSKKRQPRYRTAFYFQALLVYMEIVFHLIACHKGIFSFICAILFAIPLGMILGIATSSFNRKMNWMLTQVLTFALAIIFLIRTFMNIKFGGFLPILGIIVSIILLALPCLYFMKNGRRLSAYRRYRQDKQMATLIVALVLLVIIGIVSFAGNRIGRSNSNATKKETKKTTSSSASSVRKIKKTGENVLDIDFDSILINTAGSEKASDIASVVDYFKNNDSTNRNEYTGMFNGYNVVYVTAENFNKYAITEERTPTLFKMLNSGFVFNNFYAQNFVSDATGNEYATTNSMIPGSSVKAAIGELNTLDRNMYFSIESQLSRLGYKVNTYNDTQYDDFVFDLTSSATSTDTADTTEQTAEASTDTTAAAPSNSGTPSMVAQTTSDYVGDALFYTSYKINAGIASYDYDNNNIFADQLNSLEYNNETKAYLAYQLALDQQMQELLTALDNAGIAEKTLVVIAPAPSGTSTQSILEELSGQDMSSTLDYRSNALIVYSPSMSSPISVDKYCSSLDVLPTLSNLLGLDYDSRCMMGKDILSSASQLVMFPESNGYSFVTDDYIYDAVSNESTALGSNTASIDSATVQAMNVQFSDMSAISNLVFSTDFYQFVDPDVDISSILPQTPATTSAPSSEPADQDSADTTADQDSATDTAADQNSTDTTTDTTQN